MTKCDIIEMKDVQAPSVLHYQKLRRLKHYVLCEDLIENEPTNSPPLQADEIVEQCLALVYAMLNTQHQGVKESLTYVLQERLQLLQNTLS